MLLLTFFLVYLGIGVASEKKSFLDTIKDIDEPFNSRSVHQVQPVTQPTVLAKEEYQGGSFRVLARKEEVERYRCSSCHTDKEVKGKNAFNLTHGNVVINHGQEGSALACIDCHHPKELDYLEDKKGNKIDYRSRLSALRSMPFSPETRLAGRGPWQAGELLGRGAGGL